MRDRIVNTVLFIAGLYGVLHFISQRQTGGAIVIAAGVGGAALLLGYFVHTVWMNGVFTAHGNTSDD